MTSKKLYELFLDVCPWYKDHVDKYKVNRTDGGIDIFMTDGSVMNFQMEGRKNWMLKKVQ